MLRKWYHHRVIAIPVGVIMYHHKVYTSILATVHDGKVEWHLIPEADNHCNIS